MNVDVIHNGNYIHVVGDVYRYRKQLMELGFRYDINDMIYYKYSESPIRETGSIYINLRFKNRMKEVERKYFVNMNAVYVEEIKQELMKVFPKDVTTMILNVHYGKKNICGCNEKHSCSLCYYACCKLAVGREWDSRKLTVCDLHGEICNGIR